MRSEFQEQLELVHRLGIRAAQQIEINLAVIADDQEYNLTGNFFYIKDAPDADVYVNVKVNSSDQPAVSWTKQTGFRHPFDRLYITTPAGQVGTMKILIAAEAPKLYDVVDNRSAISEATDGILAESRGDTAPENWGNEKTVGNAIAVEILAANVDRKSCIIQAKRSNTGIVYIGYANTVTTTKWIAELESGDPFTTSDYRGPLFARADTAGQLVGYGEH
ncbi:hypothetical protein ES702_07048 [subsurface metagenome]